MAGDLRLDRGDEWRRDVDRGDLASVGETQPAVFAPYAFLNRCLASQRRAVQGFERPRAKMGVIDLSVRRFDDLSVSGALERGVRGVLRGQEMDSWMQVVGAFDDTRPRHRDGVIEARAALCRGQIVPAAALEEMRTFHQAVRAAGENVLRRSDRPAGDRVPFLQQNAKEGGVFQMGAGSVPMVPDHVEEPLATIVVVKQRRVEAARVDVDRVRPRRLDCWRGNDVIVRVLEVTVETFDVGIDEPELAIRIRETGRPDPAGVRLAAQIELRCAFERPSNESPIDEIA